jgi:hypothetical protein
MTMKKLFFIIVFWGVYFCPVKAGVIEDLLAIKKVYANLYNYSVELTYNLYTERKSSVPYSSDKGTFVRNYENEYLKVADIENYNTPEFKLTIDNELKNILVFPPGKQKLSPVNFTIADKMCQYVRPIRINENLRGYFFSLNYLADEEIEGITLIFNVKSFFINKVLLFYRTNIQKIEDLGDRPKLEIIYSGYNTKPEISNNFFKLNRFVSGKGESISLTSWFNNYQVTDFRN